MKNHFLHAERWLTATMCALLLAATTGIGTAAPVRLPHPPWINSAVVYCVYPAIFSSHGFNGIQAQLPRLKRLGINVLWLMPVTPVGKPYNGHPSFNSPYCVHDYFAVNPDYGTAADLKNLVKASHRLKIRVILDEVLNHTAWDNPLTTEHPEYYRHSDGNPLNPNSEEVAFNWNDVAQLDYSNPRYGLWSYMNKMLNYWLKSYGVDGFRFDSADNPRGPNRRIPKAFWQQLRSSLEKTSPDVLMLGEEADPELALAPFELDYGWPLRGALQRAATQGNSVLALRDAWVRSVHHFPRGMLHMALTQDSDLDADLQMYGGAPGTLDVAVFNNTINGVPLLYNGEEVGNDNSGNNIYRLINWNSPNKSKFQSFYQRLLALRSKNAALQQGSMTWKANTDPTQVATYERTGGGEEFYVEINFSSDPVSGDVAAPVGGRWIDVTPAGSPGGRSHTLPGKFSLRPHDFAIFKRSL